MATPTTGVPATTPLNGSYYGDRYVFNLGDGQDTINDNGHHSNDSAYKDTLTFGNGINQDNLWFSQSGDDLLITVVGTDDQITVDNWFLGDTYQIEEINAGGAIVNDAQVEQLVNAMAAFAVPSGAGNVIPQETIDQLQPTLSATWQTV